MPWNWTYLSMCCNIFHNILTNVCIITNMLYCCNWLHFKSLSQKGFPLWKIFEWPWSPLSAPWTEFLAERGNSLLRFIFRTSRALNSITLVGISISLPHTKSTYLLVTLSILSLWSTPVYLALFHLDSLGADLDTYYPETHFDLSSLHI